MGNGIRDGQQLITSALFLLSPKRACYPNSYAEADSSSKALLLGLSTLGT